MLDDQLYIYDFQSQKYLIFDKGLELKEEIRTPYYFRNIIPLDSILVAYTGRMSQLINEQEFSYDLMILDKNLNPVKYVMPFQKKLVSNC